MVSQQSLFCSFSRRCDFHIWWDFTMLGFLICAGKFDAVPIVRFSNLILCVA